MTSVAYAMEDMLTLCYIRKLFPVHRLSSLVIFDTIRVLQVASRKEFYL
jgi:hypothetical protein